MKKIVFLSPYPNSENIKEGMMQRVSAIDEMFSDDVYDKTYIVPRFKTFKTEYEVITDNIVEIKLSIWKSFFNLLRILKEADIIYCHSLYGMSLAGFFFTPFIKRTNFIWDVHGIIPEEIRLAGHNKLKQFIYSKLESLMIKRASKIIVVTNKMKSHLIAKYKHIKGDFLIYPIIPNTINIEKGFEEKDSKLNILYSGNMQGYQNIPLMIKCIKNMLDVPNICFYILTGQKEAMIEIFKKNELGYKNNIFIETVQPSELGSYYKKAHYGFVLRDDVDVNNVACPTKIIEYLAYGMTCITLNSKIGDFEELGFNYITVSQLNNQELKPIKSLKNHDIYLNMIANNEPLRAITFLLN